ncbi:tRNA lysidine(34) synthetase TilS [Thiohalomonas denitrificans]|uniref:tRNA lysidine(34) synthetase TilS n=1 Tax=Thiohalomonas denitrificans TaxID=415747 RepID=UPI0015861142|nr:tRNA lysidine(34) synthetase TilS [Thiohalomonas denitrificans]
MPGSDRLTNPDWLLERLGKLPVPSRYRVAFSGGLDSTVLLHLMASVRERLTVPLDAVHVDHGLHPHSGEWARQCEAVCRRLGVPLEQVKVDARPRLGEGPEAAAREARYRAFVEGLEPDAFLLTAHHEDDQAETLLLQMLRGAGPRGLAGMPEYRPLGKGWLVRPLLALSRSELRGWAEAVGLVWIEDPGNFDTGFDRNRIRHDILPGLTQCRSGAAHAIARSAMHCAEASELLDELATADLEGSEAAPGILAAEPLRTLSPARLRNVLRVWIRLQGLPVPDTANLNRISEEVMSARGDSEPLVHWPGAEVRGYRGHLYAMAPLEPVPKGWQMEWSGAGKLVLPAGLGELSLRPVQGRGLKAELFARGSVSVHFRKGGEHCRPAGRGHSHLLKKLFQEAGIPPWERGRIPILGVRGESAAVAGLCYGEAFVAAVGEAGLELLWNRGRH